MLSVLTGGFHDAVPRLVLIASAVFLLGGALAGTALASPTGRSARPASGRHVAKAHAARATAPGPVSKAVTGTATQSCVPAGATPWSAACWRPYAATSPFNEVVPAKPSIPSYSAAVVNSVLAEDGTSNFLAGPTVGYEAVYYTNPSAPLYTIHCTEAWGTCAVEGVRLHIPATALPAPNQDHHMVVIDAPSNIEYDFWETGTLPAAGGTLDISWGGQTSITGAGLNSDSNAATFGGLAGVVRASELKAGLINHALVLSVNCDNGTYVWPATKADQTCPDGSGPAMGQRLQLNMTTAQIKALAIPAWNKTVLQAFATYGAYVEDTGNDPWAIKFESGQTYTSIGQPNPWLSLASTNTWSYWAPDNDYVGSFNSSIPWNQLRVISPCVAQRTC
jgi:hypothetical protein